jgi:predicted  nucleic acid-binding Zn-ribbon protein
MSQPWQCKSCGRTNPGFAENCIICGCNRRKLDQHEDEEARKTARHATQDEKPGEAKR